MMGMAVCGQVKCQCAKGGLCTEDGGTHNRARAVADTRPTIYSERDGVRDDGEHVAGSGAVSTRKRKRTVWLIWSPEMMSIYEFVGSELAAEKFRCHVATSKQCIVKKIDIGFGGWRRKQDGLIIRRYDCLWRDKQEDQ